MFKYDPQAIYRNQLNYYTMRIISKFAEVSPEQANEVVIYLEKLIEQGIKDETKLKIMIHERFPFMDKLSN